MHEFGTTPEQLAQIAVQCRANAANNPDARFRDPIEVADVLASPMIATPLHRLDCCIVVRLRRRLRDGRRSARPSELAQQGVYLLGWGEALGQLSMNQMWPFTETAAVHSGARAFESAGLTPSDIDVAQIYDSFTITVLLTLESLGFCAKGEGGAFVGVAARCRSTPTAAACRRTTRAAAACSPSSRASASCAAPRPACSSTTRRRAS